MCPPKKNQKIAGALHLFQVDNNPPNKKTHRPEVILEMPFMLHRCCKLQQRYLQQWYHCHQRMVSLPVMLKVTLGFFM